MGRVGFAAYQRMTDHYGLRVVGVDYDGPRVERLAADGLRVIEGDATDLDFWHQLRHSESVRIAVLAMPRHGANVTALACLRESGFSGEVAAVARYDDEVQWAKDHGVDIAFNVYAGAGLELADQVAAMTHPRTCSTRRGRTRGGVLASRASGLTSGSVAFKPRPKR